MDRVATRFFVAMSAAILVIVLAGFARTLYLHRVFEGPPLPIHVLVHGVLLTAWFVLVVVQTALIRRRSFATHQRLGVVAICVGAAVVASSAIVTLRLVDRVMHTPTKPDLDLSVIMGAGADAPLRDLAALALWGNLTSLLVFAVLLGCAVLMRRRGDVHKRLMIAASLSILPPAIARISRWPGLGGDLGPIVPIVMLLLLAAMVGFDLYTRRRVHRATLVGGGLVVLGIIASSAVARSEFGLAMLRRLG